METYWEKRRREVKYKCEECDQEFDLKMTLNLHKCPFKVRKFKELKVKT